MDSMIWTEEMIRAEIKRLDRITGLQGGDLPITFNKARNTLACYRHKPASFTFSIRYFQDPAFPREEALDTIRHEYAHYMDEVLYGESGHGATWKACCRRIGARPMRLYQQSADQYFRNVHKREAETQNQVVSTFQPGTTLRHPAFGIGQVLRIVQQQPQSRLEIRFDSGEVRSFSAAWCLEHCSLLSAPDAAPESAEA